MKKLILFLSVYTLLVSAAYAETAIRIDHAVCTAYGQIVDVPITLAGTGDTLLMGGFDLVISFQSPLTLHSVEAGELLADCQWEYFTYGPVESNSLRITAIAETNNGPVHPVCYGDSSGVLAVVRFIIPGPPGFECRFLPLTWKWYDCGDNAFSSVNGDTLFLSRDVYGSDGTDYELITGNQPFPTTTGAPDTCQADFRSIDFYNGGIHAVLYDNIPPYAHCPVDTVVFTDPGRNGAVVTFDISASDNCSGTTVTSIPSSGYFFPVGLTPVIVTATDIAGNSHSCDFTVTVLDNEPPIAVCPDDMTVPADSGVCRAIVQFLPSVIDNVPGAIIICNPSSGYAFPMGTTHVTCIAADLAGNTDTCGFDLTVYDDQPPVIDCPPDITISNDSGLCAATVYYDLDIFDNCGLLSVDYRPPSGTTLGLGTHIFEITAIDAAGLADTCSFTLDIIDTEPPRLTLPADIVVDSDSGQCGGIVEFQPTAADNCGAAVVTCTPASGSLFPVGTTPVTCIATDVAGNADTGVFQVTVRDIEPPRVICPADTFFVTAPGLCGATAVFSASAEDNCSGVVVTTVPESGTFFETGPSPVLVTATDAAGLIDTCSFTVWVFDTEKPAVLPPADTTVVCPVDECGAIVTFEPAATDNCGVTFLQALPASGSYFEVGRHDILIVARDERNNTDSATFAITVVDTQAPQVTCPGDISVANDSGLYGAVIDYVFEMSDNCPDGEVESLPPTGSIFPIGTTDVSVVGSDASGNADTCGFRITVTLNDADADGIADWDDNCRDDYNPDQADDDGDGIGDVCDWIYGDANDNDEIDIGDAVFIISYTFKDGPAPVPPAAGDANCDGECNIGDAVFLISYIFKGGPMPDCDTSR